MHDWLAHRARSTPDREALVNASSGNAWSYATLDKTVEEMAGRLAALGVDEGDHLVAAMESGVEEVCLIHAAMRLGAVLVPLPPEFTPPELADRFVRVDADAVVCDAETESQVRGAVEQVEPWLPVFTIDETDWADATPLSEAAPTEFTPATWEREETQLLLFTSGTTGEAKAVTLTMGNLLASATASAFRLGIDPADRWLVPLSLHHMGGIAPILRSTLYGTTAIVRESFEPGGTVDDLREYDATCVSLVPTMLRRMLDSRGTLPDSLRFALVGGAPCPEELIERCRDYSVPICPTYGMTETASQVATARHKEAYDHPDSVGQPLLWTDVTVVDSAGTPVERGESGELVVRGPTVTPGYYDDPAATGEAIGSYGLHTGDVGYRDERGRLYVLNRLDDRIITGGENVDPGEVVDAILTHPSVEDAAVVGLDDEEWGEEVAALLVPADDDVAVDDLEAHLRERLAGFKLPRTVGIAEELPRTVSGTVERDAVREQLREDETVSVDRDQPSARAASDTESVRAVAHEERDEESTRGESIELPEGDETDGTERPERTAEAASREGEPTAEGENEESISDVADGDTEPLPTDDTAEPGDGKESANGRRGGAALSSPNEATDAGESDQLTGTEDDESGADEDDADEDRPTDAASDDA
ncbi:AMP-binding protein [Halolamina sp. CBA1230]|uniref:AMP-binding protein n=1 Tax=Halolamina sp. CBA1230 TaxID=1853690 RepID=UPI0009A17537|nr:AMP-binding protein [Halolamina sp. CBA1230]QKY19200.1 AMP-binding protein [Halolamina sp. CBA1230]